MKIQSAKFIVSNTQVSKCPQDAIPEYAFIGRSNVGKSSLINRLTQVKGLAKTSSKPGKTQLINHFQINENWFLVDLPGYGYAKTAKTNIKKWQAFIEEYFRTRENLMNTFILLDARLEPQKVDLDFMMWCAENALPFSMVFTKSDKLSKNALQKNLAHYKKEMLKYWEELPPIFVTSSETGEGREELLAYIQEINELF